MKNFTRFIVCFLCLSFFSWQIHAENPSILDVLVEKDFSWLDAAYNGFQKNFENGKVSETELRNAFRTFYALNAEQEAALNEWVKNSPKSYSAHLARGIFLKRAGLDARGTKFASETPKENIAQMRQFIASSKSELTLSLNLSTKPYLSVFHLLDIAQSEGDEETSRVLIIQANKMLPDNRLARDRYMVSMQPKWGGSREKMQQFLSDTKMEGVDQEGIMQLEAIMHVGLGDAALIKGDAATAKSNFITALDLGKKIGGTFKADFLGSAVKYMCDKFKGPGYCE